MGARRGGNQLRPDLLLMNFRSPANQRRTPTASGTAAGARYNPEAPASVAGAPPPHLDPLQGRQRTGPAGQNPSHLSPSPRGQGREGCQALARTPPKHRVTLGQLLNLSDPWAQVT